MTRKRAHFGAKTTPRGYVADHGGRPQHGTVVVGAGLTRPHTGTIHDGRGDPTKPRFRHSTRRFRRVLGAKSALDRHGQVMYVRPGRVLTLNCVQPDPPDPWASGDVRGASPRPREGAEMGCTRGPDLTLNQVRCARTVMGPDARACRSFMHHGCAASEFTRWAEG